MAATNLPVIPAPDTGGHEADPCRCDLSDQSRSRAAWRLEEPAYFGPKSISGAVRRLQRPRFHRPAPTGKNISLAVVSGPSSSMSVPVSVRGRIPRPLCHD